MHRRRRILLAVPHLFVRVGRRLTLAASHQVGALMVFWAQNVRLCVQARDRYGVLADVGQACALIVWAPVRLTFLALFHCGVGLHAVEQALAAWAAPQHALDPAG